MNPVRLLRLIVVSCTLHVSDELAIHEYVRRAVAIPAPVSMIVISAMFAVVVVVVIVPVAVIIGEIVSIRLTVAIVFPVLPTLSWNSNENVPLSVNA